MQYKQTHTELYIHEYTIHTHTCMHMQHTHKLTHSKYQYCGTSCSLFQTSQETNVAFCEHEHSPAVPGRCYQVCVCFFIWKKHRMIESRHIQNVCVCKMWQAPFEVGVSNVQVKCYERKMLSLKAGSVKWKNNMASVVWWFAEVYVRYITVKSCWPHAGPKAHNRQGSRDKVSRIMWRVIEKIQASLLDEATPCSHIQRDSADISLLSFEASKIYLSIMKRDASHLWAKCVLILTQ